MENSLKLPIPKKYGYIFTGWLWNDKVITSISKGRTGNINLTAQWKGTLTKITKEGTYTINDEIAIVDFSKSGTLAKVWIYIDTNVKEISFIGSTGLPMSYKSIEVLSRTTTLTMRLKNVSIYGHYNTPAIDAFECSKLILEAVGVNWIRSGTITSNNREGFAALACRDIDIIGDELHAIGSSTLGFDGIKGLNADSGIFGGGISPIHTFTMNISINKLECSGGNGGIAKNGPNGNDQTKAPGKAEKGKVGETGYAGENGTNGGLGGDGGYGILYLGKVVISANSSVVVKGGNGGNAGNGGNGGKGGAGGEGGNAKFGVSGKAGGQGGTGGAGGAGGSGGLKGDGILAAEIIGKYTATNGTAGNSGLGGKGGAGGAGGLGGFYLNSTTKRHETGATGHRGADGEKGEDR